MKILLIYTFSLLMIALTGCGYDRIPGVYRIDIQQGNDVTQEMINKLQPGMNKSQVAFAMGSPLIIDTFHPERWVYYYSFQPGNGDREQRQITLFFENEELAYIDGDTTILPREDRPEEINRDVNVVVPLSPEKNGLFGKIKNASGFGDNVDQTAVAEQKIEDASSGIHIDTVEDIEIDLQTQPTETQGEMLEDERIKGEL